MRLECIEADGMCRVGPFRVEPLVGHPKHNWRIVVADGAAVGAVLPTPPTFRSLRACRTHAEHLEWMRLRRIRIRRLLVLGTASSVAFVVIQHLVASVLSFTLAVVLLVLALRSLSAAVDLCFMSAWEVPEGHNLQRVTFLDRATYALIESLRRPASDDAPEKAVRVLPPIAVD